MLPRLLLFALSMITATYVHADPSSTFWTPCTTEIVETGFMEVDVDNFFTVFNRRGHGETLPPDVGLEWGAFTWKNIGAELGFDYLGGKDDPVILNGKVRIEEDKLFKNAPSFALGVFNANVHKRANEAVFYFVVGKTFTKFEYAQPTIYLAGYTGKKSLGKNSDGFMFAFDYKFDPAVYEGEKYMRWRIAVDYASGKNQIGGGGVCLGYNFTPNVRIKTGPVWFNDQKINGKWKWGVQIELEFPITKKAKLKNKPPEKSSSENKQKSSSIKSGNQQLSSTSNSVNQTAASTTKTNNQPSNDTSNKVQGKRCILK